jgi:hypothetical protein
MSNDAPVLEPHRAGTEAGGSNQGRPGASRRRKSPAAATGVTTGSPAIDQPAAGPLA